MIDVKATLTDAEERMEMAAMFLKDSLDRIRAGRANVAILSGVRVNSYGSMVPLNQVANVSCPDARTIAIRPWDKKAIKDIEKAIMDSDVGITPENNGEIVHLRIPQPTGAQCERRHQRETEESHQRRALRGQRERCRARTAESARQVYKEDRRDTCREEQGNNDNINRTKEMGIWSRNISREVVSETNPQFTLSALHIPHF